MLGVLRLLMLLGLLACGWPVLAAGEALPLDAEQRAWLAEHRQLRDRGVVRAPHAQ